MIAVLAVAVLDLVPIPYKPWQDQAITCKMSGADGRPNQLSINLRYEKNGDRDGFWWTIAGDDRRYPSNQTAQNMYSNGDLTTARSQVYFKHEGQQYTYTLFYRATTDNFPHLVPEHLTVVSRRYGADAFEDKPVGIGFCAPKSVETNK